MSGIASNPVAPPRYISQVAPRPRSEAKRSRIIDAAMQHFAENGYHAARVGDIAAAPGLAALGGPAAVGGGGQFIEPASGL